MFLGDLIAVLEAIDLLETLKACACLPGFTVVAIRLHPLPMQLTKGLWHIWPTLCRQLCKFAKKLWIVIYLGSGVATTAVRMFHVTICQDLDSPGISLSRTFYFRFSHQKS